MEVLLVIPKMLLQTLTQHANAYFFLTCQWLLLSGSLHLRVSSIFPSLWSLCSSLFFPLQALSYAGGFGKMLLPHVVEKEVVQDDGSVVKRSDSSMGLCRKWPQRHWCLLRGHWAELNMDAWCDCTLSSNYWCYSPNSHSWSGNCRRKDRCKLCSPGFLLISSDTSHTLPSRKMVLKPKYFRCCICV